MINKTLIIFSFFIFVGLSLSGQTCTTDTLWSSQSDIDNFQTNYPGCTTILNDLRITGTDVTNLNGLSAVTTFMGNLKIDTCPQLTSLIGLNQVDTIYSGFYIEKNDYLQTLDGINNLKSVEGELKIRYNNSLSSITNIGGLNHIGFNLEVIGNPRLKNLNGFQAISNINRSLYISANDSLTSVTGLDNLQSVGELLIMSQNPQLADLSPFNKIESIGVSLILVDNPALASLDGLQNITSVGSKIQIENCAITDLQGLNGLTTVHDSLIIYRNPNLTSLAGLANISSMDVLKIKENPALISLDGLTGLHAVGDMDISYNSQLTSLEGLQNVTDFNGSVLLIYNKNKDLAGLEQASVIHGYLGVNYNHYLKSLDGLDNLKSIDGFLAFSWNDSLTDVSALSNLDSVKGGFVYIDGNQSLETLHGLENMFYIGGSSIDILNNPKLTFCAMPSICYHQTYANHFLAENNGPGCATNSEIENACGGPVIQGTVHADYNNNCQTDANEEPLANWLIRAIGNNDTIQDYTDKLGFYKLFVPSPGTYSVTAFPPDYWSESCTGTVDVSMDNNQDVGTVHFYGQEDINCPLLSVDVTSPTVTPCQNTYFKVKYCNNGTVVAHNTQVTIKFGESVTVTSAMFAGAMLGYTDLGDNTFRFDLSDAFVGNCQEFTVFATISCDAIEGQAICAYANITPNENCAPVDPNWSGASIQVSGKCTAGNVILKVKNVGVGTMNTQLTDGIIVEDWVLLREQVQLNPNDSIVHTFPADGKTYALKIDQEAYHPGQSNPIVVIEGCGTNASGTFSTGYTLQLPEDDADPFKSIDCQEVRLGITATDQQNFPIGYGGKHYIERGQDIEYKINFQNTGADTLRNMVIKEVLSKYLDKSTLQLGASSQPYILHIYGDTLFFKMPNLSIPPKDTNEVTSQGFIKFRISQLPELPNDTKIENTAFLYYGTTDTATTNTVFNTIGEDFILVDIFSPKNPHLKLNASPNPFYSETTFQVDGISFKTAQFFLYDQMGQLVRREQFSGKRFKLLKENLKQGVYSFEILFDNNTKANGRLTVF